MMNRKYKSESKEYQNFISRIENVKKVNDNANRMASNLRKKERQINSLIEKLTQTRADAEELITNYYTQEQSIRKKLERADLFYTNSFIPLRKKLIDRSTGLKKTLNETNKMRDEIILKRDALRKTNSEFRKNVTDFRRILSSIKKIESNSVKSNKNIERNEQIILKHQSEVENILKKLQDNNISAKNLNKDISAVLTKVNSEYKKILDLKNDSKKIKQQIDSLKVEASQTNDKISFLYEIATNKTMAGAFDERRKSLTSELSIWQKRVFIFSLVWFGAIFVILMLQIGFNDWKITGLGYDFYLRFLFTAPIAYYLFFCVAQFNTIRKAHDKYSFKTTIALSIEAHTELLRRNFDLKEYESEILEFSLNSLKKVYDEPYYTDRAKEKIDLKRQEAKEKLKPSLIEKLFSSKDNELYKLLNKALNMVNYKNP